MNRQELFYSLKLNQMLIWSSSGVTERITGFDITNGRKWIALIRTNAEDQLDYEWHSWDLICNDVEEVE